MHNTKIPWRRKWQHTPVFLLGKFHEQRSLAVYIVHGVAKSLTVTKQQVKEVNLRGLHTVGLLTI